MTTTTDAKAVKHMLKHVKFTGSEASLTDAEKALLTFVGNPANIADAVGKKNLPGGHEWSTAEVYRVEPGVRISVLCENGYLQEPLYFIYNDEQKTWFRVKHFEPGHGRGVPAVLVAQP